MSGADLRHRAPPTAAAPLLNEQPLGALHYRIVGLCFAA